MVPEKLKKGDEIRIIAPSRSMLFLEDQRNEYAKYKLEKYGFKVTISEYANDNDFAKSASIKKRVEDIHNAFLDKNVKAILTATGGYNVNQLLKEIDYEIIKNNPKIICGFSDITALLNAIYSKTGLITYHGPHFFNFGMDKGFEYTYKYFKKMLIDNNDFEIKSSKEWSNDCWWKNQEDRNFIKNDGMFTINQGEGKGKIIGGNLCTLNLLQGTEFMPDLTDKILFIEDDDMAGNKFQYEFDRNLESLMQQPNFHKVKGIVFGRSEKECNMNPNIWKDMIKNKRALDNIPIIGGCDFGHTTPMITFPIGGQVEIYAYENNNSIIIKHSREAD